MRKRVLILGILITAAALGFVFSGLYQASATDAPHNFENTLAPSTNGCSQTCHTLHNSTGDSLSPVLGNVNLCVNCHKSTAPANTFVLPANNTTVPGTMGIHHQYNVPYTNLGASSPTLLFPGKKHLLEGNNLICSSCHAVHNATTNWGTQKMSANVGSNLTRVAGGGTGTITLSSVAAATNAKGYKIKILVGGATGVATFILSNDSGLTWWYWSGGWTTTPGAGKPTGANVDLNDGTNVQVTFAGNFSAGPPADEFQTFYVSYPFLRGNLDAGANSGGTNFCRGCHNNRVNTYTQVEGPGDGVTKFNHPVGQALNANGRGYDRSTPLDVNGQLQGASSDTISSNDLRRDASGNVQCYSCHNIHFGDSNSLTKDSPMEW